ncbi:hypothetical protein B0O99DRAFT_692943 [Bisporella sp. PMI_857]|nr:hypothetical protein B0O99DRAFT_692943 [Bisporella sp. PMI_857]
MQSDHSASTSLDNSTGKLRSLVETLPDEYQEEFMKCTTGDKVLERLQEYGAEWRTHRRRLGVFVQSMKPFFAAFDIFVQCDPIHAATLWGGLRVVLQLGENFVQFLDKLTSSLEKIAGEIKYFIDVNDVVNKLNDKHQKEIENKINAELQKKMDEGIETAMLEEMQKKMKKEMRAGMHEALRAELEQLVASSPRLQKVLRDVFEELVQYLLGVFRIFYHPDGRSKNGLRVFAKAVWKPFRFDDTLARMTEYRERILQEMTLLNLKISNDTKNLVEARAAQALEESERANAKNEKFGSSLDRLEATAEREAKYTFMHRAREWLDPSSFADRCDDAASQCAPGTTGWLFEYPYYVAWSRDKYDYQKQNLWVRGNPGSGKTVLAASVIQELKQNEPHTPVCYYLFNSTQNTVANDSSTAYRALLSQILQYSIHDDRLNELFRFAMYFQSVGQRTASKREVGELIELCVRSIGKTYLVLDALDECDDLPELVAKLQKVAVVQTIRLAFFCRPTVTALAREIPNLETLTIGLSNNEDINLYLLRALEEMKAEGLMTTKLDPEETSKTLTRRADGMFLWARLMVTYLKSPALYPAERQKAISELDHPEGLDVMYERILHLIERGGKAMHRLASGSFLWLLYGERSMTPSELESALIPADIGPDEEESWKLPDFENTVIHACGGFVEQSHQTVELLGKKFHPFRFIHASVKEYFAAQTIQQGLDSTIENHIIPPRLNAGHAYLATVCLNYLTYRVPAQPLSGALGKDASLERIWLAFPFSNYAMLNWTSHLEAMIQSHNGDTIREEKPLYSALERFLAQPKVLMAWIEGCYIYGKIPRSSCLREWGVRYVSFSNSAVPSTQVGEIQKRASELGQYLDKLECDWGQHLQKSPAIIWEEVVAFTPSPLLLKHAGISIQELQPSSPLKSGICQEPINLISQLTHEGSHHIFLSVYTSKLFECHSKRSDTAQQLCEDRSFSKGWIVRYEILRVSDQRSVAYLEIPLPEFEVWVRVCETLLRGSVQIPISMTQDCHFFTVIGTLYHVKTIAGRLVYTSHCLPVDSVPCEFWGKISGKFQSYKKTPAELTYKDFCRFRDDDLKRVRLYWIHLDDRGENLCYATQKRSLPTTLQIYRISVSTNETLKLETELIAERSFWSRDIGKPYGDRDCKEFEMCFHPYLPIVVYAWAKATYVWNFATDKISKAGQGSHDIAFLACSNTGDSCILTPRGSRPIIIPLFLAMRATGISDMGPPGMPGKIEAGHTILDQESAVVAKVPERSVAAAKPWTLAQAILGEHKTLTSSTVTVAPDGSFNHVSVLNVGRTAVFNRWHNGICDESLILSRLPNWAGAESAKTSVIRPSHESEPIKVVFDKSADTWSKVSSRAASAFPLVVERDIRSFTSQSSTNLQFLSLRDTSRSGAPQQIQHTSGETRDED